MVRLKERSCLVLCCFIVNFNSTMVRLKANVFFPKCKGYAFQFHYGTIKRLVTKSSSYKQHYFNSTMVRLKVLPVWWKYVLPGFQFHYGTIKRSRSSYYTACSASFQFHYGTIKRRMGANHKESPHLFQFHYGTIKRKFGNWISNNGMGHFNSTMVRLKARRTDLFCWIGCYFNSTMVRLKEVFSSSTNTFSPNFNSTMVRLKVAVA